MKDQIQVLTQQEFPLSADPAWWVPVLLAIMGGLLHGLYKILRLMEGPDNTKLSKSLGILLGSDIAGLIGFCFLHSLICSG